MKFLALLAATALVAPASAAVIHVNASGVVDVVQGNVGYAPGATLNASLDFDSATFKVLDFTIGTYMLTGTFDSAVTHGLAATDFVEFTANQTDGTGATTGTGFDLYLAYNTSVSTLDLPHLLNNSAGFDTNPADFPTSTITFTNNSARLSVDAVVNSFAAPEPITLALLGTAGAALAAARRRR